MKTPIARLLGVLLLTGAAAQGQSSIWWDRNVVKIDGNGAGGGLIFAVGDQQILILTALHVIKPESGNLLASVSITFRNDPFQRVSVRLDPKVVKIKSGLDLAIFPAPKPAAAVLQGLRRLPYRSLTDADLGHPVSMVGFAGDDWKPNAQNNTIISLSDNAKDLDPTSGFSFGKTGIEGGFSGSPVMTADDTLIGILNSTGATASYATKIDTILQAFPNLVPDPAQLFLTGSVETKPKLPVQAKKGNLLLTGCLAGTNAIVDGLGRRESGHRIIVQDLDPGSYEVRIVKANFQGIMATGVQVTEGKTTELPCALKPDLSATWLTAANKLPQSVIDAAACHSQHNPEAKLKKLETLDLGGPCADLKVTAIKEQGMLLKAEIQRFSSTIASLVLTVNENGDELNGTITDYSTGNPSPIVFKRVPDN